MGEINKVYTKGSSLFNIKVKDRVFSNCTIETLDGKKFGVLDSKGKLVLVIRLNTKETREFFINGYISNSKISIMPMHEVIE